MRFMMMIKSDAKTEAGIFPGPELFAAMDKFNGEMAAAGVMLGAEGLQASSKGARVRLERGKTRVLDGPFAEAKELIAGFWLIQAPSLDAAVGWAKRVPTEGEGEIELRRLWEMSDFPPAESAADESWRASEERFREEYGQGQSATDAAPAVPSAPPRKPGTTRFIVMLKSDAATESGNPPSPEALNKMGALMDELAGTGALLGGEGLRPSREGARVKVAGGKRTVLDGPFSESKELIAGYTMIQVPALADAIAFAKRWLAIHVETGYGLEAGEIEIRRVFEAEDLPADLAQSGSDEGLEGGRA